MTFDFNSLIQDAHFPPLSPPSPAFNLSQHQGLFQESVLHIGWPKYWSFSFSIMFSSVQLLSRVRLFATP